MKTLILLSIVFLPIATISQNNSSNKTIYLIPGQGSDGRLFDQLNIEDFETKTIEYIIPEKGSEMASYAKLLSNQIDTSERYSIVGVSLGGMLAIEMGKFLQPEEIVLIASAKTKNELPAYCNFFQKIPVHKILGGRFYKFWILLLQPIWEPMDNASQKIWRDMLRHKDPTFMKRAVQCIVEWDNETFGDNVYHIHGTKDRTIRIKQVKADCIVQGGTHVMTMTKAAEISELINEVIN